MLGKVIVEDERTSARVRETVRTDAIWYRRRLMHSDAAGRATVPAMMIREASDGSEHDSTHDSDESDAQISHQMGAGLRALPCHTIELTKRFNEINADQNMKRQVPEFQAWRCHGKGIKTSMRPMSAAMGKAGYEGSISKSSNSEEGYACRTNRTEDIWERGD